MNVSEILKTANAAGVELIPEPDGRLTADGPAAEVNALLPDIRTHKAELLQLLAANDPHPAPLNRLWQVTLPNGDELTVSFRSTVAEMQARYPGADIRPASATMIAPPALAETTQAAVTAWLDQIGETDQAARDDYLGVCAADPRALNWTLGQLHQPPAPQPAVEASADPASADGPELDHAAAILEHDGGLDRETAERIAKGAARAYYNHLMAAESSGCGCWAPGPSPRFCPDGQALRDTYFAAAREAESLTPPRHQ